MFGVKTTKQTNKPNLHKTHKQILQKLQDIDQKVGMTVGECWHLYFSDQITDKKSLAPRFNEMKRLGLIKPLKNKRKCRLTKRKTYAWIIDNTETKQTKPYYRPRKTEYHVIKKSSNKLVQRTDQEHKIKEEFKNNQEYEIWRSISQ